MVDERHDPALPFDRRLTDCSFERRGASAFLSDLGFALTRYEGKLPRRLVDTGGLARRDRITHRIELKSVSEIDAEVKKWLKTAYDLDA